MKIRMIGTVVLLVGVMMGSMGNSGCGEGSQPPVSASGVQKAEVKIEKGADGFTTEQRNVRDRLIEDNKPGSIKHLYVISAFSGQVIIYSTVRGKVTSGGKRLTPTTVHVGDSSGAARYYGFPVNIGGNKETSEVLQDDGTYGSSVEYLYWWDTRGVYHQHYVSGGQILHISSQPLSVRGIIINMEISGGSSGQ